MEYTDMDKARYIRGIEADLHVIEHHLKDINKLLERLK